MGKKQKHEPINYIYRRCSTSKQDLEAQRSEIKHYCDQQKIKIDENNVYEDEGISGYKKPWQKRKIATIRSQRNLCGGFGR